MNPTTQTATTLNPIQMHLLHLFSRTMSETELKELKKMLVEWYDQKAQALMDKIWEERELDNNAMDALLERPRLLKNQPVLS